MTLPSLKRRGHRWNLECALKSQLRLFIILTGLYDILLRIDIKFLKLRLEPLAAIATAEAPINILYVSINQGVILSIEHHHIGTLTSVIIDNKVIIIEIFKVGISVLGEFIKVIVFFVAALFETTANFWLFGGSLHS
jgi:hypothetical protein